MRRPDSDRDDGRYRTIKVRTWGDEKFRALSAPKPNAQFLWFHLLTGPHTTAIPGLSSVGEAALAEAAGKWPLPAFRRCWREIAEQTMGEADWQARVVWLPHAIEHNEPQSPSVVKSWVRQLVEIPECELKNRAIFAIGQHLSKMGPAWSAAWVPGWETVCDGGCDGGSRTDTPSSGTGTGTGTGRLPIVPRQPADQAALEMANSVLVWLNEKTGKNFRFEETNLGFILARLKSGILPEQLKAIVTRKVREADRGEFERKYLRPATLFNRTKCEQYLGELPAVKDDHAVP